MGADVWRQAKGVLAEALMCPSGEREAWVAGRCADPVLRQEVQAYLHDYDEEFLETVLTVSDTFDHVTPSDEAIAPDIEPGVRVGRYVVLDRLGAGGMGRVYLGNDTGLHRKVALKCLIASGSAGDLRAKILHEAQAAARINHPNIAVVHDVVEHEGRPFLVMEYVEGESLAAVLRRERPPVEKILSMGRQLASALTAAHAKGIIHRDLKPANIQVTPDGSVKILDFGVAQAMSGASTDSTGRATAEMRSPAAGATLRTTRGVLVHPGTPAYMSPEQMFGQPIDQRSDIYSLGVVLYEMAAGHRPYSADNPLDLVLALSRSVLRPTGVETHLSPGVRDVIGKMLAVKVEERYQSAAEVEAAIAALMAPEPSVEWERSAPRSRLQTASRVAALAVGVPLCILVLGFAQTATFNLALGRNAPFNAEPWTVWMESGVRSLVLPVSYQIIVLLAATTVRFGLRAARLSGRIDHLLSTSLTHTRRLGSKLNLEDPVVLAQGVAAVGGIAMAVVVWRFFHIVDASTSWINVDPAIHFRPFAPGNRTGAGGLEVYAFVLSVLALVFGIALFSIARLRARQRVRGGVAGLAVVVVLFVGTVVILELPYRLQWRNKFERVEVAGERCYLLGQHGEEWLTYCPDTPAPHNRVVTRTNPGARRLGVVESIFTPAETSR